MVKLEVNDNLAKSAIDGDFTEIVSDLILGLVHVFMTFESHVPGTGHQMLRAINLAIVTNTIVEAATEAAAESKPEEGRSK